MRGLGTIFDSVLMLLRSLETLPPSLEPRVYPVSMLATPQDIPGQVEVGFVRKIGVSL